MSCMSLSKNHYQFIADSLYRIGTQFQQAIYYTKIRDYFGSDCNEREAKILALVNALQAWNDKAYDKRYSLTPEDSAPYEPITSTKPLGGDLNAPLLLKACECVHYQCIDSKPYTNSTESILLAGIINETKDYLIDQLPAYKAAAWSIP